MKESIPWIPQCKKETIPPVLLDALLYWYSYFSNSLVDWYRNYTTGSNESRPTFVGQSDEPVYDLKDHPDFKYRPGSIVIRVANFSPTEKGKNSTEEMSSNSGGQVLDNYPSGKVLVWWPKNKTSECWPQDLYKVR